MKPTAAENRRSLARACAAATLSLAAGCAAAPRGTTVAPTPRADPAPSPDVVVWPDATEEDRRLAAEVLALTRAAATRVLPALGKLDDLPVRVVVTDERMSLGSAYLLAPREVRIERRYLSRLNLAHEATHALVHARLRVAAPTWFDEALAQLVAYEVARGRPLALPAGRPVSDFAALRAAHGAAWRAGGGGAYAEAASWLGYLLPDGPASPAEKAAFARFVARLVEDRDPAAADAELRAVR